MSGGGGGGYGGPTRRSNDCNIVERVPLNSPQASVIKGLKRGDVLRVEVHGGSLVATHKGKKAGALTPAALVDLLDCIDQGREYQAIVVKRQGALCEVEIRPK